MNLVLSVLAASVLSITTFASEFAIHRVVDTPTTTSKRYARKGSEDVHVDPTVLYTGSDIIWAKMITPDDGTYSVRILFRSADKKRLTIGAKEKIALICGGEVVSITLAGSDVRGVVDLTDTQGSTKEKAWPLVNRINRSIGK